MNNLLTLMHDTARPLMFIDSNVRLIRKRLEELNIKDEFIEERLTNLEDKRKMITKSLDDYYLKTKQ